MKAVNIILCVLIYLAIMTLTGWWSAELKDTHFTTMGEISITVNGLVIGAIEIIIVSRFYKWFNSHIK